jgi:hypothetical protein
MNCQRCGTTITEQTFSIYRRRCVPCFNRLPIARLKKFCSERLPFLALFFVIPVASAYHLLLRLWHIIAPVPFKRSEIIRLMTPHFGLSGAVKYVNGLKRGFHEGIPRRICGTHTIRNPKEITSRWPCYTIGREDGAKLRRNSKQLQQILDLRCSAPYQSKSTKPESPKSDKGRAGIKIGRLQRKHTRTHIRQTTANLAKQQTQ